jgi:hypothetical protein
MYTHTNITNKLGEGCSRTDLTRKVFITLLLILEVSVFNVSPEVAKLTAIPVGFPHTPPLSDSKKFQIKINWFSFSTLILTYLSLDVTKSRIKTVSLNKLPPNKQDFIRVF